MFIELTKSCGSKVIINSSIITDVQSVVPSITFHYSSVVVTSSGKGCQTRFRVKESYEEIKSMLGT